MGVILRTCGSALAMLIVFTAVPAALAQPTRPHARSDGHVLMTWLHGGSSADYREQVAALPGVTVVTPTWWRLDAGRPGILAGSADPEFVTWARDRGLAVWPQLSNGLDAELSHAVLADSSRRARLVRETAAAVEQTGAHGIVVAFDNLREATGAALTAFVGDLQQALPGRVVAVTVAARTSTWSLGSWSDAYERRALAEAVDYLILQAVDQHHDASGHGPVAGLKWTRESVEHLLATVPDRTIILSVPLYVRDWVEDPSARGGVRLHDTVSMTAMAQRLSEASAEHEFDPVAGQRRYTYTDAAARTHHVWQEDPPSLARRAELATRYNLGGVAAWRAGFAAPEAWQALSQALAADPRPPGRASGPPRLNPLVPPPRLAEPSADAAAEDSDDVSPRPSPGRGRPAIPYPVMAVTVATVLLAVVAAGHLGVWFRRPVD